MTKTSNTSRLIESVVRCGAFHDFATIIRDVAERAEQGDPIKMTTVFGRREKYAAKILQQTSLCSLPSAEANDIVHTLLRTLDMTALERYDWVDDSEETQAVTVADIMAVTEDEFKVIVKKPGECFKYQCSSKNETQHDDFVGRRVYDMTTIDGQMNVRCW